MHTLYDSDSYSVTHMLANAVAADAPDESDGDRIVQVLMVPALGYLPVRVRITDANGDFVDQKWLSSETAP